MNENQENLFIYAMKLFRTNVSLRANDAFEFDRRLRLVEAERAESAVTSCVTCSKLHPMHGGGIVYARQGVDDLLFCSTACFETWEQEVHKNCQTSTEPTATEPGRCEQTLDDGRRCTQRAIPGKSNCWGNYHKYFQIGKATEPDVPDEDRCHVIGKVTGRRCRNKRESGNSCSSLLHNFPAASDVPYKHWNTCGMRSHGTNAELRSQVKTLRAKLKAATGMRDEIFFYMVGRGNKDKMSAAIKTYDQKAGDA